MKVTKERRKMLKTHKEKEKFETLIKFFDNKEITEKNELEFIRGHYLNGIPNLPDHFPVLDTFTNKILNFIDKSTKKLIFESNYDETDLISCKEEKEMLFDHYRKADWKCKNGHLFLECPDNHVGSENLCPICQEPLTWKL